MHVQANSACVQHTKTVCLSLTQVVAGFTVQESCMPAELCCAMASLSGFAAVVELILTAAAVQL